jgi:hypothetical protein
MDTILVSPRAIAVLRSTSPQAALKAVTRGSFGPPLRRGRNVYVALAGVEQHSGQRFSPAQIAHAVARHPDRLLVAAPKEDED